MLTPAEIEGFQAAWVLRGSWSGTGHCGAVTIAGSVIPVGGCCCSKVFSELRGALIGVEIEVVGGPAWVAAGAVLTARTESVNCEVLRTGSVLIAEVEVEQWI